MNILRPDSAAYDVTAAWFEQFASSRSSGRRDDFYSILDSTSASTSASRASSSRTEASRPDTSRQDTSRSDESRSVDDQEDEASRRSTNETDPRALGPTGEEKQKPEGDSSSKDGRIECCFPFQEKYRRDGEAETTTERQIDPRDGVAGRGTPEQPEGLRQAEREPRDRAESAAGESKRVKGTAASDPNRRQLDGAERDGTSVNDQAAVSDPSVLNSQTADADAVDVDPSTEAVGAATEPSPSEAGSDQPEGQDRGQTEATQDAIDATQIPAAKLAAGGQVSATGDDAAGLQAAASQGDESIKEDRSKLDRVDGRGRRATRKSADESLRSPGEPQAEQREALKDAERAAPVPASAEAQLSAGAKDPNASPTDPKPTDAGMLGVPSAIGGNDGGLSSAFSAELTGGVGGSPGASGSSSAPTSPATPSATAAVDSNASTGDQPTAATHRQRESNVTNELRLNQVQQRRLMQRVSSAFRTIGAGEGELRLRLSPPQLGSMRLEVKVKDGTMHARLQTETEAARHVLTENLSVLRDRLSEQGITVESFDIDVAQDGFDLSQGDSHSASQDHEQAVSEPATSVGVGGSHATDDSSDERSMTMELDAQGRLNVVV